MSARLSHRLIAKPVSFSPESWTSKRPRSPLIVLPSATFARYVRSNSLHVPARSRPHVIRITMVLLLLEPALDIGRSSLRSCAALQGTANRQLIARFFPTADRSVFVEASRQLSAPVDVGRAVYPRDRGVRPFPSG